jgi:hypothetical protein
LTASDTNTPTMVFVPSGQLGTWKTTAAPRSGAHLTLYPLAVTGQNPMAVDRRAEGSTLNAWPAEQDDVDDGALLTPSTRLDAQAATATAAAARVIALVTMTPGRPHHGALSVDCTPAGSWGDSAPVGISESSLSQMWEVTNHRAQGQ